MSAINPRHLEARQRVVRDYTGIIIDGARKSPDDPDPATLAAFIRRASSDWWGLFAKRTKRLPEYRPDPETVEWIASLVEAHAQADRAHRILMTALAASSRAVEEAARTPNDKVRARRLETAADDLLREIGRATSALHVPYPQAEPLRRSA